MSTLSGSATIERVMHTVGDTMTPDFAARVLTLRPDPQVEQRLEELAEKNTAGLLSDDERAEYEAVILMGDLIALMQRKARTLLSAQHAGA